MSGIALNEDNSHFFHTRGDAPLTEQTVDALVDQYANTNVEHLLFSPNSMCTSYGSEVWEPIWNGYDPEGPDDQPLLASTKPETRARARTWIHTAWALDQAGIDVYKRWIARSRKHGISPWLSMRMNDIHNVNDRDSYIHSDFWRKNPELWRVQYRFNQWQDRALDYGRQKVREHVFKLVNELVERYDFDGLELDWMRFGFHFRPGHEGEGVRLLTEFTQRIRDLLGQWEKKRGHHIRLGARVPSRPRSAVGLGMDAVRWARQDLVDWLVVTPFWATIEPDMPVELWRDLLAGTGVELCAGLEVLLRPYPGARPLQTNSLETVRAAALSLLHRGADRIYLFNYMDSETTIDHEEDYRQLVREIGNYETMKTRSRRHVLTYTDTLPVGEPQAAALPVEVPGDGWHAFRLHIGPKPGGENASVVLAFDTENGDTGESVSVRLNGELCGNAEPATVEKPAPSEPAWRYSIPGNAPQPGYNVVEIHARARVRITWMECDIGVAH
ncbi:MAG: hypothetical protein ACLFWL_15730 [Candidatus Brocadiia bacterium]